ncbi:D-alanine--D-alanine ligase [Candidatus Palibaumannia cicadellinicola]|uniref:D-alanine--D-alanine ligase n=1 Tax=Baumannia cicadellinicola subsp. Homalodisca coagulata TaxID=374463 RepID=DDL_BAUCH|nr:D-alanine--D-alanine ligase [Candidatus Baumannia cicadellinicola]Q1LT82.1 RecName: Full=D-alanine--D-alanine ligase; AltName: Full=D-Ala-D-Ala ligase; AltName: Full=D-alanylalanine synthetase [Baumannia cicadellinicola str. Hc (Homalodisca coagulata)]ABF14027.1 D-ala D-ala ligase [Baumannia cicadellinicola str. Hc (Homalodisca coagulata)]MCJ7462127.1 D-alanine--D-alanine ligase [Candidatus Baumannia cicadellinicola]MCJ7462706.1 D-alanine--D-alanine ligase [Candidatus Baumannia cicadellinico
MAKLRVGIIFGGQSAEHEVSLQSAKNIVETIDENKFEVVLFGIDKEGQWHINNKLNYLIYGENETYIALNKSNKHIAIIPGRKHDQFIQIDMLEQLVQLDVIFPIVHGTLGEDGNLQGLLRMANLPFVGSTVLGSAVSMDKDIAKRLLRDADLEVTPSITLTRINRENFSYDQIITYLGSSLFVKPANQGSSVGVSKVINRISFDQALALAFCFDDKVLVESAINGRELECAVLGNHDPQASLCGEIVLSDNFYSYEKKYLNEHGAVVVVPAAISKEVSNNIQKIAVRAFQALNCTGMARVDVFLTTNNKVLVNEVNTSPGFTSISMYPKLWQASGISYPALITRLIELAIERYYAEQKKISHRDIYNKIDTGSA